LYLYILLFNLDPKTRIFRANDFNTQLTFPYSKEITDAETIEFWLKIYEVSNSNRITLIKQRKHFTFNIGPDPSPGPDPGPDLDADSDSDLDADSDLGSDDDDDADSDSDSDSTEPKIWFTFGTSGSPIPNDYNLSIWMHIGLSIFVGASKGYFTVNENLSVFNKDLAINIGDYKSKPLVIGAKYSDTEVCVFGLKEFRIWNAFKSFGELRALAYKRPSSLSPGLSFYLPLDESNGVLIYELVTNKYIIANSQDSWKSPDYSIDYPIFSSLHKNTALAINNYVGVNNANFNASLPESNGLYEEATIMIWFKLITASSLNFNVFSMSCFDLVARYPRSHGNRQINAQYNNVRLMTNTDLISPDKWVAISFAKSLGSYITAEYSALYVNGVRTSPTMNPSTISECGAKSSGTFSLTASGSPKGYLIMIKDIKIFGIALSDMNILKETYSKTDSWKYFLHLRHYFPMEKHSHELLYNYSINHIDTLYALKNTLEEVDNEIIYDNKPIPNENIWIVEEGLNEELDEKALMFIRGITHSINMITKPVTNRFTVEFWINLAKNEHYYQEIIRTQQFTIAHQSSEFIFIISNESVSGIRSTGPGNFLRVWTHVAAANSDIQDNSCIYVNGELGKKNIYVRLQSPILRWTISDDTRGFTGMLRDLRIWSEARSAGRIHDDMHIWQGDHNGMNFRLISHFPLDEESGFTLYDHSSSPIHITSYRSATSQLRSPFWARAGSIPIFCHINQIYDSSAKVCRSIRNVLRVKENEIVLPVSKPMLFREWSLHTWVKYEEGTIIEVEDLIRIERKNCKVNVYKIPKEDTEDGEITGNTEDGDNADGDNTGEGSTGPDNIDPGNVDGCNTPNTGTTEIDPDNIGTMGTDTDGTETMEIAESIETPILTETQLSGSNELIENGKWYYLVIAFSFARKRITIEHGKAVNKPAESRDQPENSKDANDLSMYGTTSIKLSKGSFMHLSLWKKHLQMVLPLIDPLTRTSDHIDP